MTTPSPQAKVDTDAIGVSDIEAPVPRRLGWSFWAPATWIVIIMVAAFGAELLQIQDPLEMDLVNQAVRPNATH